MKTNTRKGLTLLESLMAAGLLALVVILALTSFAYTSKMVSGQEHIIRMDQVGQSVLSTVSRHLSSAILPVDVHRTGTITETDPFRDADDDEVGFAGANGRAWRTRLQQGMDNIAFVNILDPMDLGNYDGANQVFLGQNRGATAYLGSKPEFRLPSGATEPKLFQRTGSPNEPVNALTLVDPTLFDNAQFEVIELPNAADWSAITSPSGSWPNIASFVAFRFVPQTVVDSSGNRTTTPVVVNEATADTKWPMDLDGDGLTDGQFHIGKLQLLYSGGTLPRVQPGTTTIVDDVVPVMVTNLTSNVVLRKIDGAGDSVDPIFRYDADTGLLRIRLLVKDNSEVSNAGVFVANPYFDEARLPGRWYETFVDLKNMKR